MLVKVFASGTNVQRLAKGANKVDGVIYTAYSQLEQTETSIVKRKFYATNVTDLKEAVEAMDETVQPNWTKIWEKPNANKAFITSLLLSLTGEEELRSELNLSNLTGEAIDCFMLLTSANNAPMDQIKQIAERALPEYHIEVLNGEFTNNKKAEDQTKISIKKAQMDGKKGVVVITNQMGSRSYSVSEIQATVIAYDRGSVDATAQKVSRCLTPGKTYDGTDKEYGFIVDLSFDPNRSENIERLVLEEAIQVQRSGDAEDFTKAVHYVLNSINLFKVNEYGYAVEVDEAALMGVFSDNDAMLRVADVSVDVQAALEDGLFNILGNVTAMAKGKADLKDIVGEHSKTCVTEKGDVTKPNLSDKDKKALEKILNDAVRALNQSATSVYFMAECTATSYRDCLTEVSNNNVASTEFVDLYGVSANQVLTLLDNRVLNEPVLDVIVANSYKQVVSPF